MSFGFGRQLRTVAIGRMKNKTFAVWLTLLLGPLGAHRIYLKGKFDGVAIALLLATGVGVYGMVRANANGLDDQISWLLIPWGGLAMAACALTSIVYGLMDTEKWNRGYNPAGPRDAIHGQTNWLTVFGLAASLLLGATVLLASIAFTFQRYFEYQADQPQALMPQIGIGGSH